MTTTARPVDLPDRVLTAVAFLAASLSGVALLLHALGWLPMYFLVDILAVPSLLLLLFAGVIARRIHKRVFFDRLVAGVWIGIAATAAYDLARLIMWKTGAVSFDPFLTHPIFGQLITGLPLSSTTAIVTGWIYHLWNGVGFAIMYTVVLGPGRLIYAVLWALGLEIAWLTALPSALQFELNPQLVFLSVIGHLAYGLVLGVLSKRYIPA